MRTGSPKMGGPSWRSQSALSVTWRRSGPRPRAPKQQRGDGRLHLRRRLGHDVEGVPGAHEWECSMCGCESESCLLGNSTSPLPRHHHAKIYNNLRLFELLIIVFFFVIVLANQFVDIHVVFRNDPKKLNWIFFFYRYECFPHSGV